MSLPHFRGARSNEGRKIKMFAWDRIKRLKYPNSESYSNTVYYNCS